MEEHGEVAVVRIDRPPANALDPAFLSESATFLDDLRSRDPGAVVITGRDGFFSAGADLKVVPSLDAAGQAAMVDGINRLFAGWYSFPRPVVCAVNGHAIAGGMILALCGDYRVGCDSGKLGLTELRAGIPYPACAIAVVKAELSAAAARVLVLRAELLSPADALALGALDELVSPDAVLPRAVEVASEMAALPRSAYPIVKKQLRRETLDLLAAVVSGRADPVAAGWVSTETASASAAILNS
ncbi:MAG: enoyl-CoA hydratase/isomerase family protein [Gaiellaceae bacterium]